MSEDRPRTYSAWWFLALFVALVGFGIYAVIAWGTYTREPTSELPDEPVTTAPGANTTTTEVPPTMVDGSPAPEGIAQVSGTPGDRVYRFDVPTEWAGEATETEVPAVDVERSSDDTTLTLTMACAVSAGSHPALIKVTEDPFEVNVTPVVAGLRFGSPCAPDERAGVVSIVLDDPVGERRVVMARPGEKVEVPDLG